MTTATKFDRTATVTWDELMTADWTRVRLDPPWVDTYESDDPRFKGILTITYADHIVRAEQNKNRDWTRRGVIAKAVYDNNWGVYSTFEWPLGPELRVPEWSYRRGSESQTRAATRPIK